MHHRLRAAVIAASYSTERNGRNRSPAFDTGVEILDLHVVNTGIGRTSRDRK
jgi:hypothetical protein